MVTTIDGKILSGGRGENVMDLGSEADHAMMRSIENTHDAVMIGAGSLRATLGLWYPKNLKRFVVTSTGRLDFGVRFFSEAPEMAWVVTGADVAARLPKGIQALVSGPPVDWAEVLSEMRTHHGIERLLVEGGSELNASILQEDLVDELYLTVAPKIKLGRDVPTYADGEPLAREALLRFVLVSNTTVDDEVFLRYQRRR